MSRQSEIDKMTEIIKTAMGGCTCSIEYTSRGMEDPDCEWHNNDHLPELLVDNGIGTKDRFYGFTASGQKEIPQIKPIDYTI